MRKRDLLTVILLFILTTNIFATGSKAIQITPDELHLRTTFEETCGSLTYPDLTQEQKEWLVALPAIIIARNGENLDTLEVHPLGKEATEHTGMLSRCWGINNTTDLIHTISRIEYSGNNNSYILIKNLLEKYDNAPVEVIELNETVSDRILNYYKYILEHREEYEGIDLIAWDLGRMTSLIRWGYQAGYLSETESWNMLLYFGNKIQLYYDSWEEYGNAYRLGRIFWASGFQEDEKYREETNSIYNNLIAESGLWGGMDWNVELPEPFILEPNSIILSEQESLCDFLEFSINENGEIYTLSSFNLANSYLRLGDLDSAKKHYIMGLRVNAKDWEMQLRVVKIAIIQEDFATAYNKLEFIKFNCNDPTILAMVEELEPNIKSFTEKIIPENYDKTLVLHFYDNYQPFITDSMVSRISEEYKINVVIGQENLDFDLMNIRSKANSYHSFVEFIVNDFSVYYPDDFMIILDILEIEGKEDLQWNEKARIVNFLISQSQESQNEIIVKAEPQYNAVFLQEQLANIYSEILEREDVLGVIGITHNDIFAYPSYNNYSWKLENCGVMSLYQILPLHQISLTEKISRIVKQGLAMTGNILGINRCTVNDCARIDFGYIQEYDVIEDEFCTYCIEEMNQLY